MKMVNHPNRSKRAFYGRNPRSAELRALRTAANLSVQDCAELVHASAKKWEEWENGQDDGNSGMHPGLWELFLVKVATIRGLDTVITLPEKYEEQR